jgi:hemoglobin
VKPDIHGRPEIELLVNTFYDRLIGDKQLAYIFNDLAHVNWSYHLPVMYNFWENIILCTGSYEGNPMQLHKHLHHIQPLTEIHFRRWDQIFVRTVDKLFRGPNASLAKERALSISAILREKVLADQKYPALK